MLYVRKLFTQDLRNGKQIAFPKEPSLSFFAFDYLKGEADRKISFTFKAAFGEFEEYDGKKITTRLYAERSESRMDGEVKAFLRDTLNAHVDDLLILKNVGTKYAEYELMFVPQTNQNYKTLLNLTGGDNHSVLSVDENKEVTSIDIPSLQQIFYGAPGTGKSYEVNETCKKHIHYRTTFHPDSDYSSFVGCYKPTTINKEKIYTPDELISKLTVYKQAGATYPCHKFAAKYWESLQDLSPDQVKKILVACGFEESMKVEILKGIAIGQEMSKNIEFKKIVYNFIPQAFIKAYVKAWELHEKNIPVYLVIEEINRGNCAQIFGDLFQLLDRDEEGYSKYEISPDTDLQNFISEQNLVVSDVHDSDGNDISQEISNGDLMKLPNNLYIWATMNTSDQSLFPIDSAFKRRWDWKYKPIDEEKESWTISVNGKSYSWSSFLKKINKEIQDTTSSEDKMLGFYFCKAEDKKISEDRFVSKVLFYLYNDVFKDYGLDSRTFFKNKEDGDKVITFQSLYKPDGSINKGLVEKLLNNLEVVLFDKDINSEEDVDDEGPAEGRHLFLKAVEFEDETFSIENGHTHFSVYLEALKKIGIQNAGPIIETSKYKRKGCKLATKEKEDGIKNSRFSYVEVGDYYVVKGAADETLINVLEEVKNKLNLNINILTYRNVLNN